jgi:hypothetical protein
VADYPDPGDIRSSFAFDSKRRTRSPLTRVRCARPETQPPPRKASQRATVAGLRGCSPAKRLLNSAHARFRPRTGPTAPDVSSVVGSGEMTTSARI